MHLKKLYLYIIKIIKQMKNINYNNFMHICIYVKSKKIIFIIMEFTNQ